jgi:hypothetical protein
LPLSLSLSAGDQVVPLRYKRIDFVRSTPVSGLAPQTGDAVAVASGTSLELGTVDLAGIYGLFMRAAGYFAFEVRAGSADGDIVATGNGGKSRIDWVIRPRTAWTPFELTTTQVTFVPSGAQPLFLVVTSGAGAIDFIDLTGSGAMLPHSFAEPLPDAIRLFNGVDIDDWAMMGPGDFTVEPDGRLRANGPGAGQWGWLYYTPRTFKNFVLRLEFNEDSWGANSGVLLRHAATGEEVQSAFTAEEIQITDVNTEYTGGIDHVQTAVAQPQSSPGDWSTMEIIANGPRIVARVNGVVTSAYDGATGCGLFALPCAGGEYGGYVVGGNGYVALEAEIGHVWFRNVELRECAVSTTAPASVLVASDDPLCSTAV